MDQGRGRKSYDEDDAQARQRKPMKGMKVKRIAAGTLRNINGVMGWWWR
jgi:hypothetical protein